LRFAELAIFSHRCGANARCCFDTIDTCGCAHAPDQMPLRAVFGGDVKQERGAFRSRLDHSAGAFHLL
jgi:hypothetical protein